MTENEILNHVFDAVQNVRKTNPLSPSITNSVTINFVANAQLAVGGSAAMVYLPDEGEYLSKISKSFYINVGTLLPVYEESLPKTFAALNKNKCPWVLDPVGIGIGSLRTELISKAKEFKPSVIRGNASEIIAVAKLWNIDDKNSSSEESKGARGVDSTDEVLSAENAAKAIALYTGGAVAISGKTDLVTDGKTVVLCYGGSKFLPMITGAGCSLGGVVAVYCAVTDPFTAALCATIAYNEAGLKAEKISAGPGTFQPNFLDSLYSLDEQTILNSKIQIKG